MKDKNIRIVVIGCGRVAQHYKKMFDSGVVSNWNLVGFCDILSDRSEYFANHFHTRSYKSFESMLENEKPDLVLVLTPSGLHYEHTKIAFDYGCNVLCEKPITMLPSQAEELKEIAQEKGLMYGTAFQNRLNPAIIALEKAIKNNRFGKIITATIRLRWCRYQDYYEDGWHGTWAQDGGVINQQAIHHVDAINWLLGPIESVNATITNRLNNLEAEDTLVAIMKFESGALGTIEATTAARPEDFEASLSVVGEKGMVLVGGIALNKIETWIQTPEEIYHPERRFFSVIGVHVEAMNREISSWDQPIIKQDQPGIIGFIVKEIDGVLHFLTQLKLESGVMDLLEISPTVQCITGNYSYKMLPKFVDEMIHRKNLETIIDVYQSEEGGRFYKESNQNIILLAGASFQVEEDQDFIWMTMSQLKQFIKFNNFLNVEARSLLAFLPSI